MKKLVMVFGLVCYGVLFGSDVNKKMINVPLEQSSLKPLQVIIPKNPVLVKISEKLQALEIADEMIYNLIDKINNFSLFLLKDFASDNIFQEEDYIQERTRFIFEEFLEKKDDLCNNDCENIIQRIDTITINLDEEESVIFQDYRNALIDSIEIMKNTVSTKQCVKDMYETDTDSEEDFIDFCLYTVKTFFRNNKQRLPAVGMIAASFAVMFFHARYCKSSVESY